MMDAEIVDCLVKLQAEIFSDVNLLADFPSETRREFFFGGPRVRVLIPR
jgi:hypothetical protein